MTYYEELGLTATASPGDIRKAHRTLSRLLHPDQQTESVLCQAAALQMRRVNVIVDMLLDPKQRRNYDERLRAAVRYTPPPANVKRSVSFSILDFLEIVAAAIVVTLFAVWLLATEIVPRKGTGSKPGVSTNASTASSGGPLSSKVQRAPERTLATGVETYEAEQRAKTSRPADLREPIPRPESKPREEAPIQRIFTIDGKKRLHVVSKPAVENGDRLLADLLLADLPPLRALNYIPPNPPMPVSSETPPATALSSVTADALEGLWLLPARRRSYELPDSARQAPLYVQLRIRRGSNQTVLGEYSARYKVPDRPISPEVAFRFQGVVDGNSSAFDWGARDGSHGALELKLLNQQSMEVIWHVTEFGSSIGIAGGAAVVIRQH